MARSFMFFLNHSTTMGVLGIKERSLQQSFFVVLLLYYAPVSTEANRTLSYPNLQLDALQVLWGAWKTNTPRTASNLAGWNSTQRLPCFQNLDDRLPNWRGVQCLDVLNCNETNDCDGYIIGLTLNNASITGILPPEIGNISTLSTLVLTGNPNLSGPLPQEIQKPYLNFLDLHDNGFNGTIPEIPDAFTILKLDLSGNRFVGKYPSSQIRTMVYLQSLSLGRNAFDGDIPSQAFVNMSQLETLDLYANNFSGALPNFTMCKNLQSLDVSNNTFNGSLPDLTMFTSLQTVKLSNNKFTGRFPLLLSTILDYRVNNTLFVLDLSGNRLTGSVTLWNGSDLGSLKELYLDDNDINGTLDITQLLIARDLARSNSLNGSESGLGTLSLKKCNITDVIYDEKSIGNLSMVLRLQGNPYCNRDPDDGTRCFCQQFCYDSKGAMDNRRVIIIASVVSGISILVIGMIAVAAVLYRARRYKRYLLLQVRQKFEEFDVKPTIFSYNELRAATRDFHPDMKLGEGGYGAVYKGILPNQSTVAVKQLFVKTTQGIDDFLNEVVLITGMKHRNLVNLKGCCLREHQRLLVYEYVDNYDIEQILLHGEHKSALSWVIRRNICLGVARGLHYLHALAHPRIIHRDIKANNVLLDKNFEPKIADFGLALLFPDNESHIMTVHVAGTKGYLAPEYASLGQLSDKVDVFSFGVLCLEILSGRRNIDETRPLDEIYLSKWAWKLHGEGKLMDLVDPTLYLQDEDSRLDVQRVINIALLCSQNAAEQRPTMARVVAMLQNDTESEVVVLTTGKEEGQLDSLRLLAFGKSELYTVKEGCESSYAASFRRGSSHRDGNITMEGLLQLSEMRVR